jgi:ABC-type multidrug transport system fused ATPase/permease subunit
MGTIEALSLAMGTAWTSGINLYATVAALGIASRAEMIQLPPDLQMLGHPVVIAVACIMYLIEFFADKVPYVDSGWDVLHTFIRVPAGAILAARSLGDMNPALELVAILAGGSIALAAHGTKAATRLAINASPEPFSNWIASVTEDITVFGSIWLMFNHPVAMMILVLGFLALLVWIVPKIFRLAKRGFQALRNKLRGVKPDQPAPSDPTALPT